MRSRLRARLGGQGMRRLAERSGWALAGTVVSTLLMFAETILLARELGPDTYGVLLLIIAFPEAVMQILDVKVKDAMNKYLGEVFAQREHRRAVPLIKLFWLIDIGVGVLCVLIVAVVAIPMSELLTKGGEYGDLMIIYAFGLLLGKSDSASGTILRVLDRFRLAFLVGSAGLVGRFGLVAAAVIVDGSLSSIVWARVAAELLMTLLLGSACLILLKQLVWDHRREPISALRDQRREILGFVMSTNLTGTLKVATTKLDTLLLGAFATPAAVALYRFALQFARAPLLLSDALYTAVFPTFARATALGNRREIRSIALTSTWIMSLTVVPVSLLAALFGTEILSLIGGKQYAATGPIFAICVLSVLPYCMLFWLRPLILTAGHPGALLKAQAIGTVIQMALLVALVPSQEAQGAAIALAAGNVVIVGLQLRFARSRKLLAVAGARD